MIDGTLQGYGVGIDAPEEIRTPDLWLRRPTLYPLGYRRNAEIISPLEQS